MPRYSKYLFHYNENVELIQELDMGVYGCFDCFKVVKSSYIIDTVSYNSDNFSYIYNQNGNNQFSKKIIIEKSFIIYPCIDVNESYIFL